MYPISFDNPNQRPIRHQPHANHNVVDAVAGEETGLFDPSPSVATRDVSSLLVVECRRDDKWRVELCTDLSELDGALDQARALRGTEGVDEVCLTLEISGAHGRESRREILRFESETIPYSLPASVAPQPAPSSADTDALALLEASLKTPDYCLDTLDFSEFAMPRQDGHTGSAMVPDSTGSVENQDWRYFDEPIVTDSPSVAERRSREAARSLLASLYDGEPPADDGDTIRVALPPHLQGFPTPTPSSIGHPDRTGEFRPHSERPVIRRDNAKADDLDNVSAIDRMEQPLFGQRNGLAARLLVVAGTLALLVLGGAMAELLAVDLTTAANAGVGTFDTFSTTP